MLSEHAAGAAASALPFAGDPRLGCAQSWAAGRGPGAVRERRGFPGHRAQQGEHACASARSRCPSTMRGSGANPIVSLPLSQQHHVTDALLFPILSPPWSLISFFCFQAVEILKTAREITMRVRYFPYSKCLPALSLLTLQHFSLGSRLSCILASLPDLCLEGCLNIVKMRKKLPNF